MWGNMVALTCISTFYEVDMNLKSICLQGPIDLPETETCLKLPLTLRTTTGGTLNKNNLQSQKHGLS